MNIKDLLKRRRIELGLTMKEVADACNVSVTTVSRWESGNIGNMKRSRIAALAKILDIPPISIIDHTDNEEIGSENNSDSFEFIIKKERLLELHKLVTTNTDIEILFNKIKLLNDDDIKQLLLIVDTFKKD